MEGWSEPGGGQKGEVKGDFFLSSGCGLIIVQLLSELLKLEMLNW